MTEIQVIIKKQNTMEVKFTDSFFESLKKMVARERWYWKTWNWVRYDFPKGIYNIFYFWRVVWNFRPWGHHGQLSFWERSMPRLRDEIKNGYEDPISKLKKVYQMNELIDIISRINEDYYIKYAEETLGCKVDISYGVFGDKPENEEPQEIKEMNRKIFNLSHELEERDWENFHRILKGQDTEDYKKIRETVSNEEKMNPDYYNNWFDGTGIRRWWS